MQHFHYNFIKNKYGGKITDSFAYKVKNEGLYEDFKHTHTHTHTHKELFDFSNYSKESNIIVI